MTTTTQTKPKPVTFREAARRVTGVAATATVSLMAASIVLWLIAWSQNWADLREPALNAAGGMTFAFLAARLFGWLAKTKEKNS
jgi:hypothetical protein